MRKPLIIIGALLLVVTTALVAAAIVGPPEIDGANTIFKLTAVRPVVKACAGEDAPDQYVTTAGTWKGSETDITPGSTDYQLTGTLVYAASVTVNQTTHRGLMRGTATLTAPPATGGTAMKVYSGPLTLIVQRIDTPNGFRFVGRGFLSAPTYTNTAASGNVKDGGLVFANVEVTFGAGVGGGPSLLSMDGQFGDSAGLPPEPTAKDYSVVTAGKTCM